MQVSIALAGASLQADLKAQMQALKNDLKESRDDWERMDRRLLAQDREAKRARTSVTGQAVAAEQGLNLRERCKQDPTLLSRLRQMLPPELDSITAALRPLVKNLRSSKGRPQVRAFLDAALDVNMSRACLSGAHSATQPGLAWGILVRWGDGSLTSVFAGSMGTLLPMC